MLRRNAKNTHPSTTYVPTRYLIIYLPYSEVSNKHGVFLILFEKNWKIFLPMYTLLELNAYYIETSEYLIYNQFSWLRGWPDEYRNHNQKDPGLNPV